MASIFDKNKIRDLEHRIAFTTCIIIGVILISVYIVGCTTTPLQERQKNILDCVKDLRQNGCETSDSFEICRQVYGFKKIKE